MAEDQSTLLDRSFFSYLKEIQRSYVALSKPQRIRVEKWVEKLSGTGGNTTWRRNRNMYVKVLLNMIVLKTLDEPFDNPPKDGPLPTFPQHLSGKYSKDLMGPRETGFWRDVFNDSSESSKRKSCLLPREICNNNVSFDGSYSHEHRDNLGGSDRDIQSLQLLVKEQNNRIILLETQLKSERVSYELQIQRMQHSHRLEISNLKVDLSASITTRTPTFLDSHASKSDSEDLEMIYNGSHISSTKIPDCANTRQDRQSTTNNSSNKITDSEVKNSTRSGNDFLSYLETFQAELKTLRSNRSI